MMKGELQVDSRLGNGSRFTVLLPVQDIDGGHHETLKPLVTGWQSLESAIEEADALNFLIVDDNPTNLEVARYIMEDLGWSADFVMSGEEALEACGSTKYDIVLMDCHLPGLDGFETSQKLLPLYPSMKIIAVTADARAEALEKCLKSGMCGFISKPLIASHLVDAVSQSLAENQSIER